MTIVPMIDIDDDKSDAHIQFGKQSYCMHGNIRPVVFFFSPLNSILAKIFALF